MLTLDHLKRALESATKCDPPAPSSPQTLHRARSSAWVKCLAKELKDLFPDPNVRVFYKGDEKNRVEFGLNELLYDICVCRTDTCTSARQGKTLRYVSRALWLVESEFARDSFEAVKDFNKLVIGSADNKLFVGPKLAPSEETGYLDSLLPVARCSAASGDSNVFVALVPHPSAWRIEESDVTLRRFAGDKWEVA